MEQDKVVLNKQAIAAAQQHMGIFAWGTVLLVAAVLVVFFGNLYLYAIGVMPLWAAFVIYAAVTYMSYTPVHEAVHNNINGNHGQLKWLNDLCGYLCALIIMVPYSTHKVEHFTHHRYTNHPEKDPDYVVKGMQDGLLGFFTSAMRFLWTQITYLFRSHWAKTPLREKLIYVAEVVGALAWRVAALALLPQPGGVVLIVGAYLVGVLFTAYWFAYRPHHPYEDQSRYGNTNSLIMPSWMKPLEWFWLGQNLHSIHHAFPRVPFYRYNRLFREVEPNMRALGNPVIGIFSRKEVPSSREA